MFHDDMHYTRHDVVNYLAAIAWSNVHPLHRSTKRKIYTGFHTAGETP